MSRLRVLYVADDDAGAALEADLAEREIELHLATRDAGVIDAISRLEPEVLVIDIGPPGRAGLELCTAVRERSGVPIISTSAIARDSIAGLEAGADDFIAKPLPAPELIARIRSQARRARGSWGLLAIDLGALHIDPLSLVVRLGDEPLALTPSEFECLHALAKHPGVTLSREQLVETIHGSRQAHVRSIDVIVSRLRQKLGDDPRRRWIKAVRNIGYSLSPPKPSDTDLEDPGGPARPTPSATEDLE